MAPNITVDTFEWMARKWERFGSRSYETKARLSRSEASGNDGKVSRAATPKASKTPSLAAAIRNTSWRREVPRSRTGGRLEPYCSCSKVRAHSLRRSALHPRVSNFDDYQFGLGCLGSYNLFCLPDRLQLIFLSGYFRLWSLYICWRPPSRSGKCSFRQEQFGSGGSGEGIAMGSARVEWFGE